MEYTDEQKEIVRKFTKILNKNKIKLMQTPTWAFYTAVCFSLRLKLDFSIRTAATDGLNLYFNPAWMMQFSNEEQLGVLIHEVLHVAYMHVARMTGLVHNIANKAADHVINLQILEKGFKLPAMRYADERFKGLNMEKVYAILLREQQQNGGSQGNQVTPSGTGGLASPAEGIGDDLLPMPSGESAESIEKKVEQILVQASIRARQEAGGVGSIPSDLSIVIEQLSNPKLPWPSLLRRYICQIAKEDYTWRKPARRYFPDLLMPSLYSEKVADLAIAVDTSGSVSDDEFIHMVTEIASIFKMMRPSKITLLQYDTRVHTITQIHSITELMNCKFTGRGGTRVQEVFEWAEKNNPQVLLNFTDGGFYNPGSYKKQVQGRTLWLIHNNPSFKEPFGKTVHYRIGG